MSHEKGLTEVEQLRKDLDTYDELFSTLSPHMKDEEWRPFEAAQDKLYSAVDDNLHMLFDVIDAQAAELERMKIEHVAIVAAFDKTIEDIHHNLDAKLFAAGWVWDVKTNTWVLWKDKDKS